MGELRCMSKKGDTKVIWDPINKDEVAEAKKEFDALINAGFMAYSVNKNGKKGRMIKNFNPKAGKIIMIPKLIGG